MRLRSFRMLGFRGFDEIQFDDFCDVNLLVGKNNIGKTTVLEAIRLYLTDDPLRITDLLISRDEFSFKKKLRAADPLYDLSAPLSFESLFYGRPNLSLRPEFQVGPVGESPLIVQFGWMRRIEEDTTGSIRYVSGDPEKETDAEILPGFLVRSQTRSKTLVPFDRLERYTRRRITRQAESLIVFLPSSGLTPDELGRIWDSVALTEDEDVVIDTLKSIAATLEKIVLVQSPIRNSDRILMAKLSEFPEPVPFKSLGDGTRHLLDIILALLAARNNVLLVDEIENGLHYTMQEQFWKVVLKQAKAWNVQVFATTHSWDCVRGFQAASVSSGSETLASASLFRLARVAENFKTTAFSAAELQIAQQEDIEVR